TFHHPPLLPQAQRRSKKFFRCHGCYQTANWRLCNSPPRKVQKGLFLRKSDGHPLLNLEQRSRSKRNKCTGYPQLFIGCNGEPQNSQCKPVNNCGGSHDFLKLWFEIWKSGGQPQNARPNCYEWI